MSQAKFVTEHIAQGHTAKEINLAMIKKYDNSNNLPIIYKTIKALGISAKSLGKALKGKKLEAPVFKKSQKIETKQKTQKKETTKTNKKS